MSVITVAQSQYIEDLTKLVQSRKGEWLEFQRHPLNNTAAIKAYKAGSSMFGSNRELMNMLQRRQVLTQNIVIDLARANPAPFQAPWLSNQDLSNVGFAPSEVVSQTIGAGTFIGAKKSLQETEVKRQRIISENASQIDIARMFYDLIFVDATAEYVNRYNTFLEADIATRVYPAGGLGTSFAVDGVAVNYKTVPTTRFTTVLQGMWSEYQANRFNPKAKPILLASRAFEELILNYQSFGNNNYQNINQFINAFDIYYSDTLAIPDPLNNRAVVYMISPGYLYTYEWVYEHLRTDVFSIPTVSWNSDFVLPPIFDGMPSLTIGLYSRKSEIDSSVGVGGILG